MKRHVWLVLAIAAFATLTILWIVTDRRAAQRIYDDYSSANTGDSGLSLAEAYLRKQRKVDVLTRPLARLTLESNAVVFRVTKEVPLFFDPTDLETKQVGPPKPRLQPLLNDAELAFVRGGGRMVIAAGAGTIPTQHSEDSDALKVFPIWPAIDKLALPKGARGFTSLPQRMHALFATSKQVVVARERIGTGDVIAISAPELFRNNELARGNHLQLLAALAGTGRPIYFDEVPHGIVSGDGALELMKEWNLGPFLLLLAIAATLMFWRAGRRIGPPEEDYRDTRSDAVDLVRSLGALYRGVTSHGAAIALYHASLTRTVAAQSGLRGEALQKRVSDLTGGLVPPQLYEDIPKSTFTRHLEAINEAFAKLQVAKSPRR